MDDDTLCLCPRCFGNEMLCWVCQGRTNVPVWAAIEWALLCEKLARPGDTRREATRDLADRINAYWESRGIAIIAHLPVIFNRPP